MSFKAIAGQFDVVAGNHLGLLNGGWNSRIELKLDKFDRDSVKGTHMISPALTATHAAPFGISILILCSRSKPIVFL